MSTTAGAPMREIGAVSDEQRLTVRRAYAAEIAWSAVEAQRVASFSRTQLT